MILVDIGNSGLRAARVADKERFADQSVYRLSWSPAIALLRKPYPEQESAPNQRWCDLRDPKAFDWLVSQFEVYFNESWLISCVQRTALEELMRTLQGRGLRDKIKVVDYSDVPMKLDVDEPVKTGIDRLLASFAARAYALEKYSRPSPVIVVQAGTAVTVDYVDGIGSFCGGAIMPGLGLSLQLLAAGTEQLPWLGNHVVGMQPELPGKNTAQAISAGVNAALVGGTSHLVQRYRNQSKDGPNIRVIVTGGDGPLLLPYIIEPVECVDHMVLRGLNLLGGDVVKVIRREMSPPETDLLA